MTEIKPIDPDKLLQMRLDYAWRYFDSASQKRMQFVNFFVLLVGILANAYVAALKEKLPAVAIGVCLFGVVCSITFMFLDHRMLVFVNRSLSVLETLERQFLFPTGSVRESPAGATNEQLGLARREPDMQAAGRVDAVSGALTTKMWFWIRVVVEGSAAICFIAGAIYALVRACPA